MSRKAFVLGVAFFSLASLYPSFAQEVLTNDSVRQMIELGFSEDLIIQKIESTEAKFDLSIEDLAALHEAGVPEAIISAMLQRSNLQRELVASADEATQTALDPGIYLYETSTSTGEPELIKLNPSIFTQARAGGILKSAFTGGLAKIKTHMVLSGPSAEMQIENRDPLFHFVFDATDSGLARNAEQPTSPRDFVLARLDIRSKKGHTNRELLVGKAGATGVKIGILDEEIVEFNFEEIEERVYEVRPKEALGSGEYCFIPKTAEEGDYIWDFSVR